MQQEQQNTFKVAPIISDQKQTELIKQIIQTILGFSKQLLESKIITIIAIASLIITILIPLVVSNIYAAIIVPSVFNVLLAIICGCFLNTKIMQLVLKSIFVAGYTILWSHHLFVLNKYHSQEGYLLFFSAVSIATSLNTVTLLSVKQFGGHSVENGDFGWQSTAYMRFFIAFPILLSEIIVYNSNVSPLNEHLYPLRFACSIIFAIWWLGWISSIKNTIYLMLNKIAMIILGDEHQTSWINALKSIITNMVPIAIYEGIQYKRGSPSLSPFIIGATVTSILTFIKINQSMKDLRNSNKRCLILIVIQYLVCLMLILLYHFANLEKLSLSIFLGIDIGLYFGFNIVKQLAYGWSRSCINIHCKTFSLNIILIMQRILLRVFSALSVLLILTNNLPQTFALFSYDQNVINYVLIPFLGYRSFKRCLSESTSFSLHLSLLISLVLINTNNMASGCLVVLMMPPFPNNFYMAFTSIFQIPPKAKHQNECCYQLFYFFSTLIGICLHLLSLGIFQLTMIFGLPIYFPIVPTQTEGYEVKSADNSLYQKIIQNVDPSIFRFYDKGYYLLRIQKYIILLQITSSCYGFCQIVDFRGLQVQQVTSCHSKQGETIDRLVEETWGDNKKTCSASPYQYTVTPFCKQKIHVPTENDIQLTGVIESKEFVNLFKQAALKSIIREYSKIQFSENQKRQAEIIQSQLPAFYKKQAADSIFPFQFAKQLNVQASYPIQTGKIKLPPISKKGGKKAEMVNDFLDLLESSHEPNETSLTGFNQKEKQGLSQSKKEIKYEQVNMALILTLYYYSVGKLDYIMQDKLFKIIKKQPQTITQIDFDGFQKLLSISIATAFKISIDKYINGQFQITLQDFLQYDTKSFLGTSDSQQFKDAILNDKQDIWTVNYSKRTLSIKRMAKSETNMYVFKADSMIIRSVWNNLRFELVYATNDNDQRYSIQTHPNILRNLWVQACEQPFGYPGFHSGLMINK